MKPVTKTFPVGCFTKLQATCILHPTAKSLNDALGTGTSVWAFAETNLGDGSLAANLHFVREPIPVSLVAHECLHATLGVARRLHLEGSDDLGEELSTLIMERLVAEVCIFLKEQKVRLTTKTRLRARI